MKYVKKIFVIIIGLSLSLTGAAGASHNTDENLIQMAILLDTSNSMDGLIDQAKSQLWKIVNEMSLAKRNNESPNLQVALYEYGKDSIPAEEGYMRMITPFTTDLDKVSEALFNLTTNGGSEYCGTVIKSATDGLQWSNRNDVLKMIFIAGNEPFTQGKIDFRKSCSTAIRNNIIVNTIFCGDHHEGINTKWQEGALLTDGKYMNIDQNQEIVHINAPQDKEIMALGEALNKTYISYGKKGSVYKERQAKQDKQASDVAPGVMVQRSVTKSSKMYKNKNWDLVDALEENDAALENLADDDLPKEMKHLSKKEQKEYIEQKKMERENIKKQIKVLNEERQNYVAAEQKKISANTTLDDAILKAIKEQAEKKAYKFE